MTLVHVGNRHVAAWNEDAGPVVGLAVLMADGLSFVACCDAFDRLRSSIAEALDALQLGLDEIQLASG